MWRGSPALCGS